LKDTVKHSDITGTSELLIIHFKLYRIISQSTALFAHTRVHYTHMNMHLHAHTYTHNTLAVTVSGISGVP